jgi:phenylacetate-coenzyme A ligase PaaK-like adenylate-forming protein
MSIAAISIERTPLERWIAERLAVSVSALTPEVIAQYQLQTLQDTVAWARQHSPYYARRFKTLPNDLPCSLDEISRLPLTRSEGIALHGPEFLCVSQSEISRVVTMDTSGTNGAPKRMFFTAADQEMALDFFARGVAPIAAPGDRMLIALPGEREGSVGYQLARGIARAGVIPISHGLSIDPVATLTRMKQEKVTSIIGLPVQMLALALHESELAVSVMQQLHSIVLCSDYVPESIVRTLRQVCGCEVFQHYGTTEMGLGGGVDCQAHMGYHLREADLYFEIVSPATGEPLPDGEMGEVVFTTLHRTGMPLIRYRTGDLSRFLPVPCACGSTLRRLEKIRARIDALVSLGTYGSTSIAELDETLFAISGLQDFRVSVERSSPSRLKVTLYAPGAGDAFIAKICDALEAIPAIGRNCSSNELRLSVILVHSPFPVTAAKRKIEVCTIL